METHQKHERKHMKNITEASERYGKSKRKTQEERRESIRKAKKIIGQTQEMQLEIAG